MTTFHKTLPKKIGNTENVLPKHYKKKYYLKGFLKKCCLLYQYKATAAKKLYRPVLGLSH